MAAIIVLLFIQSEVLTDWICDFIDGLVDGLVDDSVVGLDLLGPTAAEVFLWIRIEKVEIQFLLLSLHLDFDLLHYVINVFKVFKVLVVIVVHVLPRGGHNRRGKKRVIFIRLEK
jgi:hypothetical protein